jgi:hypothetical protein
MKIITRTRDHRESFKSKYLKSAEDFVGENHFTDEVGIDDQYTLFYFTDDVQIRIIDWVFDNRYMIWHLLEAGVEFNYFSVLVDKLNAAGFEWDEDSWELLTITE